MAGQYTKDITKTAVYKQVTGQKKEKFIDQALEGLGMLKRIGNERVNNNLQILQDENIFDVQRTKNELAQLNKFSELENELQDDFGGDIETFSKAKAKALIDQRALINLPVSESDKQKITINHPDVAYGIALEDGAKAWSKNFVELRTKLRENGVPYAAEADKQIAFIDDSYQGIWNKVSKENNYNVMEGMGSLFRGQGLNYSSAQDLKESYNKNIASSKISEITKLNNTFKALYTFDSDLSDKVAKAVKNADIRKDVKTIISPRKKEPITHPKTGVQTIRNFVTTTVSYTQVDTGEPVVKSFKTYFKDDPYSKKLSNITEQALYASLLENTAGSEKFYDLINNEGYLPQYAYQAMKQEDKKSFSQIEADDFKRENFKEIDASYNLYRDDYYFTTDSLGNKQMKRAVTDYEAGNGPRPSYYKSYDEYANQFVPVQTRVNKSNIIGGDVVILDYNLANNSDYREWSDSLEGKNIVNKAKDAIISDEAFLQELKTDFQNNDFSRVDKAGNYFPKRGNAPAVSIDNLREMGLSDIFDTSQSLGFNIKEDRVVMKNYGKTVSIEDDIDTSNLEDSDKSWATNLLRAFNDIPYAGALTELALGDEIDAVDALWLIPGLGWIGGAGKIVLSGAAKFGAKKILASKKGSEMLSKITAQYNKTKQVQKTTTRVAKSGPNKGELITVKVKGKFNTVPAGKFFGFNSKAQYDSWYKGLSAVEKAMANSISKRGGAIDMVKFTKSLGKMKGAEFVARIPGANNQIIRYANTGKTIPITGALTARQYAFSDDAPEEDGE